MIPSSTQPAPKIKFVGVFDTIKTATGDTSFDISFNESILNMRHALALNENRGTLRPECIYPTFTEENISKQRTFLQAWFIGAHGHIGGASKTDVISLYPLQWMLTESHRAGLCLEIEVSSAVADPFRLAGLNHENMKNSTFKTPNQVEVTMVHIGTLYSPGSQYAPQPNTTSVYQLINKPRKPFDGDGMLEGHVSFGRYSLDKLLDNSTNYQSNSSTGNHNPSIYIPHTR